MKDILNDNLLLYNISVDNEDHALAFSLGWIRELSKYFKQITIITLSSGSYTLPDNCKVYSIKKANWDIKVPNHKIAGKEWLKSQISRAFIPN